MALFMLRCYIVNTDSVKTESLTVIQSKVICRNTKVKLNIYKDQTEQAI